MFSSEAFKRAEEVLEQCRALGLQLTTAESCTGGLIAGCLTEVAGSSDVIGYGFVTYSNTAKQDVLNVPADMLSINGAVSEQAARAMAEGALERSGADVAVAVTGIAGPGGGSENKPVGLVHMACARNGQVTLHERCTFGDLGRGSVREATVLSALELVLRQLGASVPA